MKNLTSVLMTLLVIGVTQQAEAKIVHYGSEAEALSLVYDSTTVLRFDEDVKTISQASKFIIEPADPNEPNYRVLAIKPRKKDSTDKVMFILANDAVVSLKINTVSKAMPEKTDSFVDFRPKEQRIDPEAVKGPNVTELELMKAMIRSDNIVGYNAQEYVREVSSGVDTVTAQLVKVYTGQKFNGYIFKIENTSSDRVYAIDLKSLTLGRPNQALLSQVDEKVLRPEGSKHGKSVAYLRIVAKPTSIYNSLVLPIAPLVVK